MRRETSFEKLDVLAVFKQGVLGGAIAGLIFAAAEVVAAVLQGQPAWAPLQLIAAVALGERALAEVALTPHVVAVALGVHAVLSVGYGIILAVVGMATFAAGTSVRGMTLTGMAFGFVLWLVNFFIIAPLAFPWFTAVDQAVQFILHVFFFGAPLGFYLGNTLAHPSEVGD